MNKMRIALLSLAALMALIVVVILIVRNVEASSIDDKCSGSKAVYYMDCAQCHTAEPKVENTDFAPSVRCNVCHEDMTFNPANAKCTFIDQIYPE